MFLFCKKVFKLIHYLVFQIALCFILIKFGAKHFIFADFQAKQVMQTVCLPNVAKLRNNENSPSNFKRQTFLLNVTFVQIEDVANFKNDVL